MVGVALVLEDEETTSKIGIVLTIAVAAADVSTKDVMVDTTTITTKGIAGTEDVVADMAAVDNGADAKEEAARRGTTSMNVDTTADVT